LIETYNIRNKDVVEIGCGKGEFLSMLCELGPNCGIGFDPSYVIGKNDSLNDEKFTIIGDIYSDRYAHLPADLLCCRHVLEHIASPGDFLNLCRQTLNGGCEPVFYFEVPNVNYLFDDSSIWDLIYEHYSYFSKASLKYLFESCGFDVLRMETDFGRQYLCIDAVQSEIGDKALPNCGEPISEISKKAAAFSEVYYGKIRWWTHYLEKLSSRGKKLALWGAGSKGVSFLNSVGAASAMRYIVDINPRKKGKYVVGTGQRIISPQELLENIPDVIVVVNPNYMDEIQATVSAMHIGCDLIAV
jgi:SAM-dependent methyltransferase